MELPRPRICYEANMSTQYRHGFWKDKVYHYGDGDIHRIRSGLHTFGLAWLHGCWTELAIARPHNLLEGNLEAFLEQYKRVLFAAKDDTDKAIAESEYNAMREFMQQQTNCC